jgi:hypothetical protein
VTRRILFVLMGLACTGCYREPTSPVQRRQNEEARRGTAEPAVPGDRVQAEPAKPAEPADTGDAIIASREVAVGTYCLTAPDPWVRKQLNSPFLLAEFALPKAAGDADDGRLTVSTAGGTVENNLARWKGQFGGTPESESQETIEVGGVKITWVDYTGTFADQRGMAAAAEPKPGYRMLGAIIPLDDRLYFVKGYGPQQTVAAHADQIRSFVQSLKPSASTQSKPSGETP